MGRPRPERWTTEETGEYRWPEKGTPETYRLKSRESRAKFSVRVRKGAVGVYVIGKMRVWCVRGIIRGRHKRSIGNCHEFFPERKDDQRGEVLHVK